MTFEFSDVAFAYRTRNGASIEVLKGLSFSVQAGECVGVIGQEGAGKSTLLLLLAALLKPDRGTIRINGTDIWQETRSISDSRKRIGFAFQFPEEQFFCETVNDELMYAQKNLGTGGTANPEEALSALGLQARAYLQRSPYSLSMGEARRVALATVLMTNPEAILLDEPTVGLDGAGVEMVLGLLRRVKDDGATIVVVSHDVDVLAEVASRIIILGGGGIQEDGPVHSLFTNQELLLKYGYQLPEVVTFMKKEAQGSHKVGMKFYTMQEARAVLAGKMN